MSSRFVYPVDTDKFEKIREQGKLYVDKTYMIYDIVKVKMYEYVFMARPRRFGKSLLCNTLHAYFEGKKELFEACPEQGRRRLKIAELEKDWKAYPVLHFDMSEMRNCKTTDDMRNVLEKMLYDYETAYGTEKNINEIGKRFGSLLRFIYEKTSKPVVVIIDEYDTPMMHNLYNEEMKEDVRILMKAFYQRLKIDGSYLRFVFITGITKFSQMSIFSELNNLKQISMDDEYSGLCGITQEELDTVLRPCVEDFAETNKCTVDEAYAMLKRNYDGYHFSKKSKDVYAPFSLLQALNDKDIKQYWFESGTSKSLIDHLKHFPEFDPMEYDGVEVSLGLFNTPCEDAKTPVPLLYQSGYLSIDTYDRDMDTYILHFPNFEVRHGMVGSMSNYLLDVDELQQDDTIIKMARALKKGDLPSALIALRAYIAGIPYDIITKKEWMAKKKKEAFYKLLLYIVFSLLKSKVDTEVKSILGRADVVIQTKDNVFVLELKVDDTVENALSQIDGKGYTIPYETGSLPMGEGGTRGLTKCGITISSDARNITHWKAVDEDGNIIDEQKF